MEATSLGFGFTVPLNIAVSIGIMGKWKLLFRV